MSIIRKLIWAWTGASVFEKPARHSTFALMPNGAMKPLSIGYDLYHKLLDAYNEKYEDAPDKDTLIAAISSNYELETTQAWHAFLAEIGEDE